MISSKKIIMLATIPVIDSIADQIQTVFQLTIGGLSFLQILRGGILAIVLAYLLFKSRLLLAKRMRKQFFLFVALVVCLIIAACKELIVNNALEMESIVAYFQLCYWFSLWLLITLECKEPRHARIMLLGLLIAGLMAAISIFIGYFSDAAWNYNSYDFQEIASSSGAFKTGKFICGNLIVSSLVALFFGLQGKKFFWTMVIFMLLGAVYLTYARAGLVALGVAIIWFIAWSMKWRRLHKAKSWLIKLGLIIAILAGIGLSYLGTSDLVERWSDITEGGSAGSGRATFWAIAIEKFWNGSFVDMFFGIGHFEMRNAIEARYGIHIHTHNDFLDMLLVGGLFGMCLYLCVILMLYSKIRSIRPESLEAAISKAILLVFLVQGLLTGQLFGMSVMFSYVTSIVCFIIIGTASIKKLGTKSLPRYDINIYKKALSEKI